jgi:sortase A
MKKLITWMMIPLFILSLSIAIFSTIKIVNSKVKVEKALHELEQNEEVSHATIERNEKILQQMEVKGSKVETQSNIQETKPYPKKGDLIGKLIIPAINEEYPIFEGTEEDQLSKGVGHYIQSVLPGRQDNSVLAGHRDGVFRKLEDITVNDVLIVEMGDQTYTYRIYEQLIVDEDDRTIIVPHEEAVLTLVTCYPFDFIGSAPQRYILQAKLE